jgi:uncharacterized membrane protein HdeD (DUF308 family)
MLKNMWWVLLLRGILFVLFGIIAIGWPAITFLVLVFAFSLYIVFSGVLNLIYGILGVQDSHRYWFLLIAIAVLEIGAGAYAFSHPRIDIAAFILLIGFVFIVRGIFETIIAFEKTYTNHHRVLMSIGGVLGIIAGLIILRYPITGGLAFIWVIGLYALVVGSVYIALSVTTKEIPDNAVHALSGNSEHSERK